MGLSEVDKLLEQESGLTKARTYCTSIDLN